MTTNQTPSSTTGLAISSLSRMQEDDFLRSLHKRKNEGRLTLTASELARCAAIWRREPHLRDRSDSDLEAIVIGQL
jgi:hypothetical protein